MANQTIRVTFTDDDAAWRRWAAFGDGLSEMVARVARKREGATYVLLFRELSEADAERVEAWCARQSEVVGVDRIAEAVFWSARSDSI
ncbi:MAG TPA: hypothetical protein VH475_25990 [Tepidisphaeraceae bacterium]|jgi:hypothetical protein